MKILKILLTMLAMMAGFNAYAIPVSSSSSFTVDYDSIGGAPATSINGLSASVDYYNFVFTYDGTTNTKVTFTFDVNNTSVAPILTSRVSTLGFSTTPQLLSTGASVTGVYDKVDTDGGTVPNQGVVEFCFSDVNCAGGGAGGVNIGFTESGFATLFFAGNISTMTFDNFTVRYQNVGCVADYTGNCPGSASGTNVPEPGMVGLLAIGLIGVVVARRKMTI